MKREEKSEISLAGKEDLKVTHANWRSVYNDLHAEIKLRHYSPKTLRAYTGWARQLQTFTKSKDHYDLYPYYQEPDHQRCKNYA